MWIVHHKNDEAGELRYLSPEKNYEVGRNENADFLFHSRKAAREFLEFITGPSQGNRTTLTIRIMSRAKAIINGQCYKLKGKDDPPEEIDFTNENKITIECATVRESESQMYRPDTPIVIGWVEFNLFARSNDELLKQARDSKIDLRWVDNVENANHYYSNGNDADTDDFKLAVIKGIPILNSNWWKLMCEDKNNTHVREWLLRTDYKKFLPNGDEEYLPSDRSHLFDGIRLVSLERIGWLDTIVVDPDNLELEIKEKVGEKEFTLISDKRIDNLLSINNEQLWGYVKKNNIDGIPKNTIKQLKRPAPDLAMDALEPALEEKPSTSPKARKRRRYEKVDKLHFFSLADTAPVPPPKPSTPPQLVPQKQVDATVNIPQTAVSDDNSITQEISTSDEAAMLYDKDNATNKIEPEESSIKTVEPDLSVETAPTVRVESSQNDPELREMENSSERKRKLQSSAETEKPAKLAKFVPKVSLVEAVLQVKASNKPEVIELDDNIENLKNLAIVEITDLIARKKKERVNNDEALYAGRKNFKKFRKSKGTKETRRRVSLFTVEDKLNYEEDHDDEEDKEELNESNDETVTRKVHTVSQEIKEVPRQRIGLFLNDDDLDDDS